VRAEELLRRYLEQRRDMGERELVLDDLTVEEVMRLLGAKGGGAASSPAGASDAADDWRAALKAAGAPAAAPPVARRDFPAPPPSASSVPAVLTPGLTVGGADRELFAGAVANAATIDDVNALVRACTACELHKTAKNAVPGDGSARARLMCIGEGPGANEDETGLPFVGQAGQLLTKILAAIDLKREDVYIANVVKHRPPGNRVPLPAEVKACLPYLVRQVEIIRPAVILALGLSAAQALLETTEALGKLRGREHHYHGIPVIVTYHPAALLRNPAWKRPTWEDVQLARRILDRTAAA
jgi:DNA polymerase